MATAVYSSCLILLSLLILSLPRAFAATVTYDFDVSWLQANPDGAALRPVIGINGQWPIPPISATKGDRVIVNVKNLLGNESTSLHFHGLYMNGSNHMDGPVGTTQCPIPPGASFTYNFTVDQPGTYWYHSHNHGQYPDGLRGALIIHDPDSPYKDVYDEEIVLTFSDWYHDLMQGLIADFLSLSNPGGAEPVPSSALINDTQNLTIPIQPGKTYLFRMINIGAFAAQYVWFENHTMRVVEVDGIYTDPKETDMIYMTAAQRYSVLVTAKNDTNANFAVVASMDQDLFDQIPEGLNANVTGWLVYDDAKDNPSPTPVSAFDDVLDDFALVPYDKEGILDHVDHSITLNMKMDNLDDGANYAFFNGITYVTPKVPTLYTVLSTGPNSTNAVIYGSNTNAVVLEAHEVVEIILNNNDPGKHPFHLHGHAFQLVSRSEEEAGDHVEGGSKPSIPMKRDTVLVRPNGNLVLRFRADNPGVWLFHCHIEWHVVSGLVATFVEAPRQLQKQFATGLPASHVRACKDAQMPMQGNAAGNTVDFLDLGGENRSPGPIPAGFTARGIVALVFSVLAASAGCGAISWYGLVPIKTKAV